MKGMGMMPQQRRKPMSEINVVPYIDVMLVLLVIFMVTAPMLTQGVKVDLPETTSDPIQQDKDVESITVSVDSNGAYYLEVGDDASEPMALDEVRIALRLHREMGDHLIELLLEKEELLADEVEAFFDQYGLHTPKPQLSSGSNAEKVAHMPAASAR